MLGAIGTRVLDTRDPKARADEEEARSTGTAAGAGQGQGQARKCRTVADQAPVQGQTAPAFIFRGSIFEFEAGTPEGPVAEKLRLLCQA